MRWQESDLAAYQARQQTPAHDLPESRWLAEVRAMAKQCGLLTYHALDARGSEAGWCDLVITDPAPGRGQVYCLELKTQRGKCTMEQLTWLSALQGKTIAAGVYRPSDRDTLWTLLSARRP